MTTAMETLIVDEDGWADVIDRAARFHLDMSGDEFLARLRDGEFDDPDAGPPGLMAVLALVDCVA